MARGRAVDHDEVEVLRSLERFDLAEDNDIIDTWRRGADHVDHARLVQPLRDPGETVISEVFVQSVGGRNVNHLNGSGPVLGLTAEQLVERRLAVKFDDKDTSSVTTGRAGDHSRYRGLPDTPLARNNDNICCGQRLQRTLVFRRHLCAD